MFSIWVCLKWSEHMLNISKLLIEHYHATFNHLMIKHLFFLVIGSFSLWTWHGMCKCWQKKKNHLAFHTSLCKILAEFSLLLLVTYFKTLPQIPGTLYYMGQQTHRFVFEPVWSDYTCERSSGVRLQSLPKLWSCLTCQSDSELSQLPNILLGWPCRWQRYVSPWWKKSDSIRPRENLQMI